MSDVRGRKAEDGRQRTDDSKGKKVRRSEAQKIRKTENKTWEKLQQKGKNKFDIKIKDTFHLIEKIQNNELPDKIMINVHPQRWNDHGFQWYKELIGQNFKNVVKRYLIKLRD